MKFENGFRKVFDNSFTLKTITFFRSTLYEESSNNLCSVKSGKWWRLRYGSNCLKGMYNIWTKNGLTSQNCLKFHIFKSRKICYLFQIFKQRSLKFWITLKKKSVIEKCKKKNNNKVKCQFHPHYERVSYLLLKCLANDNLVNI